MRWYPGTNFGFENADSVTIAASSSSVAVTFDTAFPTGATVIVTEETTYSTSHWLSNVGVTGFTGNFGTATGTATQTLHYHAFANA